MPQKCLSLISATIILFTFQFFVSCTTVRPRSENDHPVSLPEVALVLVAEGFTAPVALVSANDETGRLFIADQTGYIKILTKEGTLIDRPFLDVRDRLVPLRIRYDERGLLGLAFHPNFAENGRFFIYYSVPRRAEAPSSWDHTAHLSEFMVSLDDPNQADPDSERIILAVDQPQGNHNGGQVAFDQDGYLYLGLGDGGAANDVGRGHPEIGNGRDTDTLLGSILRLDIDQSEQQPYAIPADNPFVNQSGRAEIFAYGLRNPFRFSFDHQDNGTLYAGDVGQNKWEEINIIVKGGHYGWNIKEATHCFNPPPDCPASETDGTPLLDPILEYDHGVGLSITGGFVYRGQAILGLQGHYVFGDWRSGRQSLSLFVASRNPDDTWSWTDLPVTTTFNVLHGAPNLLSFGQDDAGELYVLTSAQTGPQGDSGQVYKLIPAVEE